MTRISLSNVPSRVVCYLGTHRTPDGLWLDGFHIFTRPKTFCWGEHLNGSSANSQLKWQGVYTNAKTAAANARGL